MASLLEPLSHLPADAGEACLWVALSGGMDSTALLHALAHQRNGQRHLRAIHVHHGLRPDADAWAAHCAEVCVQLQVSLEIVRVQVDRHGGEGLEAAARKARHAAFFQVMRAGDVLVTAHHQDDQAETFLLRALRASGPDGLAAMRPWRRFAQGWLWRPWLEVARSTITTYAQAEQLRWIEDDSNTDITLDRNFLRHQVLPLLQTRWPQVAASLARSAALSAQASALLSLQDSAALQQARTQDPEVLSVPALQAMAPALRARVVRHWITELELPPLSAQGIAQLEKDLLPAAADAQARFDWSGVSLRRWRNQLHAGIEVPALSPSWESTWDGRHPLALPDGGKLELVGTTAFDVPVQVTPRRGGERIRLAGRAHSHALKHLLQTLDLPPWERRRLPLLRDAGGSVLAAGDRVYAAGFEAWLQQNGAKLRWIRTGRD